MENVLEMPKRAAELAGQSGRGTGLDPLHEDAAASSSGTFKAESTGVETGITFWMSINADHIFFS